MVAIVGRANVGKSTLFNRLVRSRRALVEDRPGVTRDRVAAVARIEDRDVLLVDTGGLDPEAEEGIPAAVRAQVRQLLAEAAVIVFVVDARSGLVPLDREIADLLRRDGAPVVVVANKADSPAQEALAGEFHRLGFAELIPASAEHRLGMRDVEIAIAERIPDPEPGVAEVDPAPRIAIIGRPNVGKSSLLNRLLGENRNIVADEPGTTRDATDSRLEVGGREVVLIDTAGVRRLGKRDSRVERGSALMALRAVERADVALLVLDASEGVADQDCKVARLALDRGRPLVLVLNKWDLLAERGANRLQREVERKLGFVRDAVILRTSAATGKGTDKLIPAGLALLDEGTVHVPTPELNRALEQALAAYAPPMRGRHRVKFYYATQVSHRPLTILIFANHPEEIPANYRRYLESFFRKRFGVRSGPIRIRFRARSRRDGPDEPIAESRRHRR